MRTLKIIYKAISTPAIINIDSDEIARKLFNDIHTARISKQDTLLITSANFIRFINPIEIIDCSLE